MRVKSFPICLCINLNIIIIFFTLQDISKKGGTWSECVLGTAPLNQALQMGIWSVSSCSCTSANAQKSDIPLPGEASAQAL